MFGKQYKLFKLLGFTVKVDLSWFFIAVLVTWSLATVYLLRFFSLKLELEES